MEIKPQMKLNLESSQQCPGLVRGGRTAHARASKTPKGEGRFSKRRVFPCRNSDLPSDFLGWDSEIEVEIARLRALRNK